MNKMSNESFRVCNENDGGKMTRRDFLKASGALALFTLGFQKRSLFAGGKEGEREEKSPFDPEMQKKVFAQVAQKMEVTLNPGAIPLPVIVEAETTTDEDFNKMLGFDAGGKRINLFLPPNTIFLLQNSEVHNLAHEFVHYIQYNYQGITDGTTDEVENEAVRIQNWFKLL